MIRFVPFLALIALLAPATAAHAQGAPFCTPGVITQTDMVGRWLGDDAPFILDIYPCGRAALAWTQPNGVVTAAAYTAFDRVPGGGYHARTMNGMSLGPWNTRTVLYKPAEPGAIQLLFWVPFTEEFIVRHAWKQ
jgi:hypothetical protein